MARWPACRSAVWGLTFKANTDDRRDSPSVEVTRRLVDLGARVQAFDPTVHPQEDAPDDLRGLELKGDPYEAASGAQVLVVLTEWDAFRWLDYERVRSVMAGARHRRRPESPRPGRTPPHRVHLFRHRPPMSRVVVAGGAGFLGSHLCDRLVERGDVVVCLDDLSTGSEENVAHLLSHDRFELVVTDVSEKVELDDDDPVDAVCNLASPASPPAYLARPLADPGRRERGHQAPARAGPQAQVPAS